MVKHFPKLTYWRAALVFLFLVGSIVLFNTIYPSPKSESGLGSIVSERSHRMVRDAHKGKENKKNVVNTNNQRLQNGSASSNLATLTYGGRLTTSVIENLELSKAEMISTNNILLDFHDEIANDFVNRTKLITSVVGPEDYNYNYFTPARTDRGEALIDRLSLNFEKLLGTTRGRQLASHLAQSEIANSIGAYDLETVLIRENGENFVRQKILNPNNGRVIRTIEESENSFRNRFGDYFEFP